MLLVVGIAALYFTLPCCYVHQAKLYISWLPLADASDSRQEGLSKFLCAWLQGHQNVQGSRMSI